MKFTRTINLEELKNNWVTIWSQLASRNEVVIVESEGKRFRLEPIEQTSDQGQAANTLTDDQVAARLQALAEIRSHRAKLLAEHGGRPFAESWEDIRKDREERSKQWL